MEFIYTVDANADEPIMLIDKHIGVDEADGVGIMAGQFTRELLAHDASGKKLVTVWVNSPGGSVTEGFQISSAMLKTECRVDTYCAGLAASIALPIFLSGRKRRMADYALLMTHPVSSGSYEVSQKFKESIITLLAERSKKTREELSDMMSKNTWMDVSQAVEYGMCDEVIVSSEENRKNIRVNNHEDLYQDCKSIINKTFNKALTNNNKGMEYKKVTNKLGLVDGANEDAMLAGIEAIENKLTASATLAADLKNKVSTLEADILAKETELATLKAEKEAAELATKEAKEEAVKNEAKAMIEGFAKIGKIKNDAETIELWTNKAVQDLPGVKNMIESLPVNKVGAKIVNTLSDAGSTGYSFAAFQAENNISK